MAASPVRRRTALFGELPGRRPRHRTRLCSGTNSNRLTGPTVSPSCRGTDPRLSAGRPPPADLPGPHLRHHPLHRHPRYRRTRAGGADDQDFLVAGGVKVETSPSVPAARLSRSSGARRRAAWAWSTRPGSQARPRRRPQDDPGRRRTPARRTWPASGPRPRRSPAAAPQHRADLRGRRARRLPYFSLEFVDGGSLAAEDSTAQPLPAREAAGWSRPWPGPCTHAHQQRHRPPRPQAGQRPADRRRHAQDHRLRPGQAAGRRDRSQTAHRRRHGHAQLHGPGAGPRRQPATSARPPTSTPWGRSSTSCSPAGRRSRAPPSLDTLVQVASRRAGAAAPPAARRAPRPGDDLPEVPATRSRRSRYATAAGPGRRPAALPGRRADPGPAGGLSERLWRWAAATRPSPP